MLAPDERKGYALWFTGPGQVELLEENVPAPRPTDVLVRAIVSLVSAGTEMNVFRGESASPDEVALPTAQGTFPFPLKFAYQIVGRVEDAGRDAAFAAGDLVFVNHPHQDLFVVEAPRRPSPSARRVVHPVPDDLSPDKAAFANLCAVAYGGLLDVPVRIGDVVAVSGLGVIGSLAATLARKTAGRLVLVEPLAERRRRAAWIGADAVVDPAHAIDTIMEVSDGRGADVYFEASGATQALQGAINATGLEGRISVISYYGKREARLQLSPAFHLRRQRIVSSFVGALAGELSPRWTLERRMRVAMEQLVYIDVEPLISQRVPFFDAAGVYLRIDQHPAETLGVLLDYSRTGP